MTNHLDLLSGYNIYEYTFLDDLTFTFAFLSRL